MPSEAIPDAATPMADTLTPHEAARVLADAHSYEHGLQQRTEGLTQMVWGIAGPGMFLTYAFATRVDGFPTWGWSVLWLPWVFAATLTTFALWRSAALSAPAVQEDVGTAGYVARAVGVTLLLAGIFTFWDPHHHAAPLLVIGGMYLAFGAFDPWKASATGRRVSAVLGAVLLAGALILLRLPADGTSLLASLLLVGGVPLAGRLWQTLRG